ncbi:MAG: hypothetical protein ACJ76S_13795 [Solirubrobacteraceae bacterium]
MAREEAASVPDVFAAAFPTMAAELGMGFSPGPPVEVEAAVVRSTPEAEARRAFLLADLAVHEWCPIALRRQGINQPADWLDQLPEIVSAADARHASATLVQARALVDGNYERMTLDYAREAADAAGDIELALAELDNRPHFQATGKAAGRCLAAWAASTAQYEDASKLAAAAVERLATIAE